ncbi:MAG: aminopeptidase P family N-terminal domain-containing protein, partial [Alphaproteobacteria bacterium]
METPSMLQNFDDLGGPQHGAARLGQLREELQRRNLTGFLTPRADEYQNEYVPASAERLLWLTGFSGSWGFAAVLPNAAALFVDGRYTLQARAQQNRACDGLASSWYLLLACTVAVEARRPGRAPQAA